jgi:hypothetical protein
MANGSQFSNPQDQAIYDIHRRYLEVMEGRLDTINESHKVQYLKIITSLTEKLATPTKPLSEIVGEMMSEAAPLLFQAMQR